MVIWRRSALDEISVRPATLEQVAALQDLFSQVISWQRQKGVPTFAEFDEAYLARQIEQGAVFLAFERGRLAGTVSLYESDENIWGSNSDAALYIHRLASLQAGGGRGIGARLINWSRQRAMELGKRWLRVDCWGDNLDLCRFYERQGFAKVRNQNTGENPALPPHYQNIELSLYQMPVGAPGSSSGSEERTD